MPIHIYLKMQMISCGIACGANEADQLPCLHLDPIRYPLGPGEHVSINIGRLAIHRHFDADAITPMCIGRHNARCCCIDRGARRSRDIDAGVILLFPVHFA